MATAQFAQPLLGPKAQFFDGSGNPLAAGQLEVFVAGSSTPDTSYPTYADAIAGTAANANPVILDSEGRANVWLQAGRSYKFILKTSVVSGSVVVWSVDNYNVAGGFPSPALEEWVKETIVPTFSTTVLLVIAGANVTSRYVAGRRIRATQTSGTVYGTVTQATFGGADTTLRIVLDGGAVLDSGLSALWYGITSPAYQGTSPSSAADRTSWVNAFRGANQALTIAIWNKIVFDTESQDNLGEWDTVNARFTPAYQSNATYFQRWRIQAQVTFDTSIVSAQIGLALNGVTPPGVTIEAENLGIAGAVLKIDYTIVAPASLGNFWEVWVNPIAGVNARGGAAATWIQIQRVPLN